MFKNYAEITDGLFIGADPAPEDPFQLELSTPQGSAAARAYPDVVVSLAGTTVRGAERGRMFVHWPVVDGPVLDDYIKRLVHSSRSHKLSVPARCSARPGREIRSKTQSCGTPWSTRVGSLSLWRARA